MNPAELRTFDDSCYLALKARDARFDGNFFTGVTSTGIYCRPVCRVRTPKRENCRFFAQAAQAEQAGFRPCLRCRPELAPGKVGPSATLVGWSMQDASSILAQQAARLMDGLHLANDQPLNITSLALRLGISDRHLRRIFDTQFGMAPLHYLQTRRLLCAKQLLTDTELSMIQVATISGFASVRRFNTVFANQYKLNPTELRQQHRRVSPGNWPQGTEVQLAYRPPYDAQAILQFFDKRSLAGTEVVSPLAPHPSLAATLRVQQGSHTLCGWLLARFDTARYRVGLTVSDSLADALPAVLAKVRTLLDLDADPQAIHNVLQASFPLAEGLRLPGALDGFELAVRAVLGQQVSVAAARTLGQRLVTALGEPIATPVPRLNRLFPSPQRLADVSGDVLGQLGIVRQRQRAILALAQAVSRKQLWLSPAADLPSTLAALQALPGIGDWTAQYIAMRALAWPDAFPAGDLALHKALGLQGTTQSAQMALAASRAWQPWRSYAVIRAWSGMSALTSVSQPVQNAP
ncbi:MAG: DNA-3-methyladenine glycosylase 2 family protein [Comamonadaceae bacterium]|nr:DNA-3-methyladenine glycosylase 2 family protein [Comamonadaceae bacterium]